LKKKFSKSDKLIISVILFLAFYIAFIFFSDIGKVSSEFIKIKIEFVFVSILFTTLSLLTRSFRQKKLLDVLGIKISMRKNISLFFSGMSMIITPLGVGGLIKSHFLKKNYNQSISKTAPVVFFERFNDLFAVITILTIVLTLNYFWQGAVLLGIGCSLLVILYLIMSNKVFLQFFQKRIKKIKFLNNFLPNPEFYDAFSIFTKKETTFSIWIISVVSFTFDAIAVYFGFLAFGQNIGFIEITGYYFSSILFGAISFLPAGIGITEGSFVGLLVSHDLELYLASSIVLLIRFTTIWFATIVGFIAYRFVLKIKINEE
jgi:glycosyltransferase 2 family protein